MPGTAHKFIYSPVPVSKALEIIANSVKPVAETEVIPVWDAVGRVLASDVVARHDYPPRPKAAYDGYAVRSADTPGKLVVIGEIVSGDVAAGLTVEPGTAVYVTTGSYMPDGADTIVPEEWVRREGNYIVVGVKCNPALYIDPQGAHVRRGQVLLAKGYVLDMLDTIALLDVAITEVEVYRRVRVGLLQTGTELFEPSNPKEAADRILRGEVAATTGALLEYAVNRYTPWARVSLNALLPDDPESISWYITRQARGLDLVVMTGGSGPSSVDMFHQVAEHLGARILFRGLTVKGIKPTSAMLVDGGPLVVAVPGYPMQALHSFLRLLYPLLKYLGNVRRAASPPPIAYARVAGGLTPGPPRMLKVKLRATSEGLEAIPLQPERQRISVTVSNVEADGLALVPIGRAEGSSERELIPVYVYREPESSEAQGSIEPHSPGLMPTPLHRFSLEAYLLLSPTHLMKVT